MPMQAESLEVLEKASVAPAQARAFVRAIEIEIAGAKDTLATKQDLLVLRQDFDALRVELRGEMTNLDAVLRGEMAKLDAVLRGEMAKLDAGLRGEMTKLGANVDVQLAQLRTEIARSVGGVTRQMYMAILGQMAVLLGFAYFFATHLC
jgi:hypothetical protein